MPGARGVLLLLVGACGATEPSNLEACQDWVATELQCFREAGVRPDGHVPADQIDGTYCMSLYGSHGTEIGAPFHEELRCYTRAWRELDCADPDIDLHWAARYEQCLAERVDETDPQG